MKIGLLLLALMAAASPIQAEQTASLMSTPPDTGFFPAETTFLNYNDGKYKASCGVPLGDTIDPTEHERPEFDIPQTGAITRPSGQGGTAGSSESPFGFNI